jgi:hypothetical protein
MASIFRDVVFNITCGRGCIGDKDPGVHGVLSKKHTRNSLVAALLPVGDDFDLNSLYPSDQDAKLWNIFIVGADKEYLSIRVVDDPAPDKTTFSMLQVGMIVPPNTRDPIAFCFDSLWDIVLDGNHSLHKKLLIHDNIFLLSAFPLINKVDVACGAIMFMRRCPSHLPVLFGG